MTQVYTFSVPGTTYHFAVRATWTNQLPAPQPTPKEPKKLDWVAPVHLHWWCVSPSWEEKYERSKTWKLHRKGWVGLSACLMSPYEEKAIKAFLGTLDKADYYAMRVWVDHSSDERPGDIGPFADRSRCFYFRTKAIRESFIAMLEALPKRTVEILVDRTKIDQRFSRIVHNKNWIIFRGENGDLLSIEEVSDADQVMLKLMLA